MRDIADAAFLLAGIEAGSLRARRVIGRGYSNAHRWLVRCDDGSSVFVKQADDEQTAEWLRCEYAVYSRLDASFMPGVLGWSDGELPALVLEDLSGCLWPPPWTAGRVAGIRSALGELAALPPMEGLPRLADTDHGRSGWLEVARDPAPFLSTGVCSPAWLDRALPALVGATSSAACLEGESMVHRDVRSDNLCFRGDRPIIVDWNLLAVGNPAWDLAFWLPSLHAEGGPPPDRVARLPGDVVAFVAGFFAARAGLPVIPVAPRVRDVQLAQLRTALPWCARVLGLPVPVA